MKRSRGEPVDPGVGRLRREACGCSFNVIPDVVPSYRDAASAMGISRLASETLFLWEYDPSRRSMNTSPLSEWLMRTGISDTEVAGSIL